MTMFCPGWDCKHPGGKGAAEQSPQEDLDFEKGMKKVLVMRDAQPAQQQRNILNP